MTLTELAETVKTREDFIIFVKKLAENFRAAPDEWENPSVDRYLGAISSWTDDMDGYFRNTGEDIPNVPTWKLMAQILIAAKYYE